MRAQLMLQKGDTIMADTLVCEALHHEPFDLTALSMHSGLLMQQEKYPEAESSLNEAIRIQPRNTRNLINRALARYNQDNYRGAMDDYNLALDIDSTNFIGRYNRGLLLASVGEDNKAIQDFNYILKIDPNDMMTLFNRARLLDQTGNYKAAIRDYTTVINEFPKFLYGYQLRAEARRKIGDIKGAMRDEEHILRENVAHHYGYSTPTSRMKNRTRKRSQIDPNDYSKPIVDEVEQTQYADEYRGKIQNHTSEVRLLPIILYAEGDISSDGYIDAYEIDAYKLTPKTLEEFREGIDLCIKADDHRLQRAEQKAAGMTASKATSNIDGQILLDIYTQAIASFTRTIEQAPKFAEAYYNRAYCRSMLGQTAEAQKDLDMAIKLKPTFARAYFNRGINHLSLADKRKASEDLSKAGELGIYQAYSVMKQANKNKQ